MSQAWGNRASECEPRGVAAPGGSDPRMVGFEGPGRALHCFCLPVPLKSGTLPAMGEGRGDPKQPTKLSLRMN